MQVYQGVKKHGFLQPHILAEQDVVITTYDVLRCELNYVDIPHSNSEDGRRFRNQKRYMAIPSPLVAVEWWRICLDEAQMVECTTAKVRESLVNFCYCFIIGDVNVPLHFILQKWVDYEFPLKVLASKYFPWWRFDRIWSISIFKIITLHNVFWQFKEVGHDVCYIASWLKARDWFNAISRGTRYALWV